MTAAPSDMSHHVCSSDITVQVRSFLLIRAEWNYSLRLSTAALSITDIILLLQKVYNFFTSFNSTSLQLRLHQSKWTFDIWTKVLDLGLDTRWHSCTSRGWRSPGFQRNCRTATQGDSGLTVMATWLMLKLIVFHSFTHVCLRLVEPYQHHFLRFRVKHLDWVKVLGYKRLPSSYQCPRRFYLIVGFLVVYVI